MIVILALSPHRRRNSPLLPEAIDAEAEPESASRVSRVLGVTIFYRKIVQKLRNQESKLRSLGRRGLEPASNL